MLVLLVTYFSQGVLYSQGSLISQTVLTVLLLFSAFYFVKVVFVSKEKLNLFIKFWTALLLLISLGFILKGNFDTRYVNSFKFVLLNLLPFYAFYHFAKEGVLKRQQLIMVFLCLLPLVVFLFLARNVELKAMQDSDNVVDNTVYLFMGLIPFVFLFRQRIVAVGALIVMWFFIVQGSKRAAVISGAMGILMFFYFQLKIGEKRHRIRNSVIAILMIFGIGYWGVNTFLENEYLKERIEYMMEGDSAGREDLNTIVFNTWYESESIIQNIFGHGYFTSFEVSPNASHNDWLELLSSFGIIGFFVYLGLFYSTVGLIKREEWRLDKKMAFICVISIGLLTTVTSRWYASPFVYSQCLLLPYLIATRNLDD